MSFELIGIIGGLLIVLAWVMETVEAVRKHKSLIDLKFSVIFFFAQIFLAIYSWQKQDAVFLSLSSTLLVIITFEIAYSIHVKKVHKKKK